MRDILSSVGDCVLASTLGPTAPSQFPDHVRSVLSLRSSGRAAAANAEAARVRSLGVSD